MSHLDLGLRPPVAFYKSLLSPVCSFSCKSFRLSQTGVLFSVTGRVKLILGVSKKIKENSYAAVSTLYTMFKVAFEELNGLKYSRIIQVFSDPYDAWVNMNTLDREVQRVFLTSDKQQCKGGGLIPHTTLILIFFSYAVLWSSLPCW